MKCKIKTKLNRKGGAKSSSLSIKTAVFNLAIMQLKRNAYYLKRFHKKLIIG